MRVLPLTTKQRVAQSIDFTHHGSLVGIPVVTTRDRGMNNDGEKYHCVKNSQKVVQFLRYSRHKGVILEGRTEQKLVRHLICGIHLL